MVSNIFVFVRQVLLKYFIIYSFARVFNFEKEKAQVTGFNFLRKKVVDIQKEKLTKGFKHLLQNNSSKLLIKFSLFQ
jgi:hypothetical protein